MKKINYFLFFILLAVNIVAQNKPQMTVQTKSGTTPATTTFDLENVVDITFTSGSIAGITLYSENFDTCSTNKSPVGWTEVHSGDGASIITNSQSASAPNSFRIGCISNWDGRYDQTFSSLSFTDSIVFAYKFKGDANTWFRPMAFINLGDKYMGMAFNPTTGKIQWTDGTTNREVATITKGVWYTVRMVYKTSTNSVDYYLNGNLDASNLQPSTPSGNMTGARIILSSGNGGNGIIYFDDILIIAY